MPSDVQVVLADNLAIPSDVAQSTDCGSQDKADSEADSEAEEGNGDGNKETVTERKKEARKRKRRGGRAAPNPELVGEVAEALVEGSKLGADSLGPVLARAAALPKQDLANVM